MRLLWIAVFLCLFAATLLVIAEVRANDLALPLFNDGTVPQLKDTATEDPDRILFVGDIMLARAVERTMNVQGSEHPYVNLRTVFDRHQLQVGNFEAAIPEEHVPTRDFTLRFSVDPVHTSALKDVGFTHLSLANNHSGDFGRAGYFHTQSTLLSDDLTPFGSPFGISSSSVAFFETKNERIALIGIDLTRGAKQEAELSAVFTYAEQTSDLQIVYVHWGTEYARRHSPRQEWYARQFVEHGADLVIGHHPHVIQDVARYDGVPVFYSLGNFIFDQYFSTDVLTGLALSLFQEESGHVIDLIPVSSAGALNAPRVLTGEECDAVLSEISALSDPEIADAVAAGRLAF